MHGDRDPVASMYTYLWPAVGVQIKAEPARKIALWPLTNAQTRMELIRKLNGILEDRTICMCAAFVRALTCCVVHGILCSTWRGLCGSEIVSRL